MKIAVFFDAFLPHIDGVVTSTLTLMEELSKQGHEILIFAPKPKIEERKTLSFAKIIWVPAVPAKVYPDVYLGLFSPRVIKIFNEFNPDVVHITAPFTIGALGLALSKVGRIPTVAVFHGYFMTPEYLNVLGIKKGVVFLGKLIWNFAKTFYNQCDYIVSPSEYVKKDMIDHDFKLPIYVCRNGFDIKETKVSLAKQKTFKKKFKINSDKLVLYVGRLSKEKNLNTLLKVFQRVCSKLPEARLLVVGDGPIKADLEKLANDLQISEQVIFVGEVKHDDLFKIGIHSLASLFVTCSTSEVQPMSFIEAMVMGLPLVVAKAKGSTEMIKGNGYVMDPENLDEFANKIIKIIKDESLRRKMSLLSKNRAKDYSVKSSYEQYIEVYQTAIKIK